MSEALLDIADVAARSGMAASALRYYEQQGLIASAGRNGLRRTYEPEVVPRLALIACARRAGFTIAEIHHFLRATPDDTALRAQLVRKARDVDEDIARLTRMRDGLRHAAVCTHARLVDCPEFTRTFAPPGAKSPGGDGCSDD
ncbi:MerR family transcriptional regulator [Nocardia sp. CC227C]|uniref:MerR family transcriptional regulator n=1 Tax=Nocardia sp. CC227C TaxID=3044562 RepID=UPI00278C0891|nr:MerR family transcriptional regulator [Nocardia sp. CC227C]